MTNEIWKKINPHFECSNYLVSNLGNIMCKFNKIVLRADKSSGYHRVVLVNDNNVNKKYSVHKLVYSSFVGEMEEKYEIDHINRNPADNRLINLRKVTPSYA